MILYRLSFLRYVKEKLKEIGGISGTCKGDMFLNPSLKAGRDILREGVHEDHIIHAIRYFAAHDGYGTHYMDLNAGFGAIACDVLSLFEKYSLFEPDQMQAQVLRVNVAFKDNPGRGQILSKPAYPAGKIIARCERVADAKRLLGNGEAIVIFQNRDGDMLPSSQHKVFQYGAGMDKEKPLRTLWNLLLKGYAFRLTELSDERGLAAGDYIFLPKGMPI